MPINAVKRSQQIGAALKRARLRAGQSIRQCSAHLGISIRRYSGIEQGTSYITAVELEELVVFLDVPPHEVWPPQIMDRSKQRFIVDAYPGQSVEIVVNIGADSSLDAQKPPKNES